MWTHHSNSDSVGWKKYVNHSSNDIKKMFVKITEEAFQIRAEQVILIDLQFELMRFENHKDCDYF